MNYENIKVEKTNNAFGNKIDVILKLIINVVKREDEGNQCICTYRSLSNSTFMEDEVIPGISINFNKDGNIELPALIKILKNFGYPLTGSMVQVYSYDLKQYILFGSNIHNTMILKNIEMIHNNVIKMKCTCYIDERYMNGSNTNFTLDSSVTGDSEIDAKKSKKHKERKIGYIIEKVNLWRKLYNGYVNDENKFVKLSLVDAAKQINIPKKTLDDYLRQLRLGRKFGYDFNKNKETKVGDLRDFVKKKNLVFKKPRKSKKSEANESFTTEYVDQN